MRELLYSAAEHYKRGVALSEEGKVRQAVHAFGEAVSDLHAVRPQRMRDVLLAQVHLSRYQTAKSHNPKVALQDLRFGYSYARTTREPAVQELAESLWHDHLQKQGGQGVETL